MTCFYFSSNLVNSFNPMHVLEKFSQIDFNSKKLGTNNNCYWQGSEHLKNVNFKSPLVLVERLSGLLPSVIDSGHNCFKSPICRSILESRKEKRNKIKLTKQKLNLQNEDNINETIEQVILQNSINSKLPKIGDKVCFKISKFSSSLEKTLDAQKGKVISIDHGLDLIEIKLCQLVNCKSKVYCSPAIFHAF